MNYLRLTLAPLRKLLCDSNPEAWHDVSRCQYMGEEGNDFVREAVARAQNGLCIAKFGTTELRNLVAFIADGHRVKRLHEIYYYLRGYQELFPNSTIATLCHYSGFFPMDLEYGRKWRDLVLDDVKDIDILGSYQRIERCIQKEISHTVKIDIQSYIAPFQYEHPWTSVLQGKRVLVISSFSDSIAKQYARRERLFDNTEALPEFGELITIPAVQTLAGNPSEYPDWFAALESMKEKMSAIDYDVALIGCGAYGMHLAVHAKRMGRIGIHTAGWTQMLFGVYGNRWLNDEPQFQRFINPFWVRPSAEETPQNAQSIENGCYW